MRPDVAAVPTAVAGLRLQDVLVHLLAILAPRHVRAGVLLLRQYLGPAVLAENVHGLGVVVLQVFVVALAAAVDADVVAAVLQPLLRQRRIILTGAEGTGDGRGGQRRALAAVDGDATVGQRIDHAAALRRALLQVVG